MLHEGAQLRWIQNRVNLPTEKSSAEISRDIPAQIRTRSYFSARVSDAEDLERFRSVTDDFLTGKIGRDEARNILRRYARDRGLDDGTEGLRNIGGTRRINLILDQNAKMAKSVGQYERMHSPGNMEAFPYVIYHASVHSKTPRSEHQKFDGRIFSKDDPWLKTHFPPWEFNCTCELEECSGKKAGKTPERIQVPTPPEKVTVESKSGFAFDPGKAFDEYDMSRVKNPEVMGNIREETEILYGDQVRFENNNATVKFEPKQYRTFEDEKLPSAKEWIAAPSPKRIDPDEARKRLEIGFDVKTGDGHTAIMDQAVLDHWEKEEHKCESDIQSRLSSLNYAIETLEHPSERWDQEKQSRYLKKFKKTTGGYEGCMVVITEDGKCRTYFLPSVTKLDKSRTGIKFEIISKDESSTGRSATQTTEAIAAPGRSDDRDINYISKNEKVKSVSAEEHQRLRTNQKRQAWIHRVERSGLPESVQRELLSIRVDDVRIFPKIVVNSTDFKNTGYAPNSNVLDLRSDASPSDVSHELTHVWQVQAQEKDPKLTDEIRQAQQLDWERLKKTWGGKIADYDIERISTQNKLAKTFFGELDFGALSGDHQRTILKFLDAAGSVSSGKVGGNHGDTRKENRDYFAGFDKKWPAQEALAQIRCEMKYGDSRFDKLFPALSEILKKHGML